MRQVYIIAGHHKKDPGAISGGLKEADLTIEAKKGITYFLKKHYPDMIVLNDEDSHTLSQVIKWIKETEGSNSLIVDLHWNSAGVNTATGAETLISNNASQKSKDLAKEILDTIVSVTGLRSRGVKRESDSARGRLGILNTKSPATIVELGFINNPEDVAKIAKWDAWLWEDLAHTIAKHAKS